MSKLLSQVASPKPVLGLHDAIAIIVGIVIGAGIFETPALVAANANDAGMVVFLWLVGSVVSLMGAPLLCRIDHCVSPSGRQPLPNPRLWQPEKVPENLL
jgi:cytochrome c biogenesis protein CcdA